MEPESCQGGAESDTREELEADVRDHFWHNDWCRTGMVFGWLDRQAAITEREQRGQWLEDLSAWVDGGKERMDELRAQMRQLEGDLKGARESRDHWQSVASRHAAEVGRLRAEVIQYAQDCVECGTAMPRGVEWPRFSDGELVKPFDKVRGFDDMGVQKFIYTTSANGSWQLQDAEGNMLNVFPMADGLNRVKRPPLIAADGQPIEVGQVLYGESDGKAWTVGRIDYGQRHSVIAHCGSSERGLKPGWLTHEKPVLASDGTPIEVDSDAELRAERDRYRGMCGRLLDAARETRRIADACMPGGGKDVMWASGRDAAHGPDRPRRLALSPRDC